MPSTLVALVDGTRWITWHVLCLTSAAKPSLTERRVISFASMKIWPSSTRDHSCLKEGHWQGRMAGLPGQRRIGQVTLTGP